MSTPAVAKLLAGALAERDDEDACFAFVEQLREHPDAAAVIAAVEPLVDDPDPHAREVAIDVYCEAGKRDASEDERRRRMARILARLDAGEAEWRVLESIAYAFWRLWQEDGAERIAALAGHPEARVREAVTHGIGHTHHPASVAALIALSSDPVDDIRDWATFGLGSMHSASRETPEVAAALVARLDDPHAPVVDEAIDGLAVRRDPRAIDRLVALIEDGWEGIILSNALLNLAATFPDDPRLIATLPLYFPDGVVPDEARAAAMAELEHHDECVADGAG